MGSVVKCPNCNQRINIPPQMAGQDFLCPMCKTRLAPQVSPETQPPPPRPAAPNIQKPVSQAPLQSQVSYPHPAYPQDSRDSTPQPSFRSPQHNSGGSPVFWFVGIVGGGCFAALVVALIGAFLIPGLTGKRNAKRDTRNLMEARSGFQTKLTSKRRDDVAVPEPPAGVFDIVEYESPAGNMSAYLSKPENAKTKHPAIIWKFGGFSNRIGTTAWDPQPRHNDQSASAFRRQGIVMMYPSLRGGNRNPGHQEGLYGEVDDILAAAKFLEKQDFVDPDRIYLGGHSTGGTLVLLCAAASDRFRAVFSFGPVDDVSSYGPEALPFDIADPKELSLRNPSNWIHAITTPTFLIEGAYGNSDSLRTIERLSRNNQLHFYLIPDKGHFDMLGPMTELLASKVVEDTDRRCNIEISTKEIETRLSSD